MNRTIGALAALAAMAALSACGSKKDPNVPTDEESRQLDNAAQMLDAPHDNFGADQNVALGNGDEGTAEDSVVESTDNSAGNAH